MQIRIFYFLGTLRSCATDTLFIDMLRRSKGLTEIGLAALGYDDVIIFRPGLLMQADRPESRIVENIAEYAFVTPESRCAF